MKKHIIFLFTILTFTACAKPKKIANSEQNQTAHVEKQDVISPEIQKLNRVLVKMSPRCKDAIPNGNSQEFLDDLYKVLETENDFSKEDLSPFFLIDKKHFAPENYEPKGLIPLVKNDLYAINKATLSLRPEAYDALATMAKAAKNDGVTLTVSSTYRDFVYQKNLFDYWVSVDGLEEAERESARAGTSQHQLGLALDFAPVDDLFAETKEGDWVYKNAADFGWSLSFPSGYEDVTGYRWESWHFRYVGVEACKFQQKWFSDVQQFMIEFIDAWKNDEK